MWTRWLFLLTFFAAVCVPGKAFAVDLSLFGSVWDGRSDPGFGSGVRLSVPVHRFVDLHARASYVNGVTARKIALKRRVDAVPLDLGGAVGFMPCDWAKVYALGGASYVFIDPQRASADDRWGWYTGAGANFGPEKGLGAMLEVMFRGVQSRFEGSILDDQGFNLNGAAANLGIRYSW